MTNRLKLCKIKYNERGYDVELDDGHTHVFLRATPEYLKQIKITIERKMLEQLKHLQK